ncbi:MAG TPA: RecQ family ATP-dependent DNA helicase [Microscillaceae bacterium]|jgi:ATP-dependent DNA helicase RecQ|nr:RecQ family ATP-dependent DNA helicase [Microscillaceae bacterium]
MTDIYAILKQYWQYDHFRPLQEAIIQSVLDGHDTLALLPTGGGKSICFQVSALAKEGVCLVVSPLIALMKDQVMQLQKRGITAKAVYSGMNHYEIDKNIDLAVSGQIKFLYLSPERLKTEMMTERVKKMKVGLLAIDEAHCISQWGYDFRPAYLEIATFRELLPPQVPLIALTATATPEVKKDIQEKLSFKANAQVFQKSFARPNLAYVCRAEENKAGQMIEILQKVGGSAVVYTRNRKRTQALAQMLQQRKISADFYHAGLPFAERNAKQDNWINDKTRVMVATNAFGMGIDKPDVRVVIHWDLPDSLEAYYQEAGRAGRDEKKAFAVALYQPTDLHEMKAKVEAAYPPLAELQRVYQALANFFQVPVAGGQWQSYDFDIAQFQQTYQLHPLSSYYALKRLEECGLIAFNEAFYKPSQLISLLAYRDLYEYKLKNRALAPLIDAILRAYGSEVFGNLVDIQENTLARALQTNQTELRQGLQLLHQHQIFHYSPQKDKPQVLFTTPRQEAQSTFIDYETLMKRKQAQLTKIDAVAQYAHQQQLCRTAILLHYFGENLAEPCGVCDNCLSLKKKNALPTPLDTALTQKALAYLSTQPCSPEQLRQYLQLADKNKAASLIQHLLETGLAEYTDNGNLQTIS